MSDGLEFFTVLNGLHDAIEENRHHYRAPSLGIFQPKPLELNITVHAEISGEDELSDFLRKLRDDLRDQWERTRSSHSGHDEAPTAFVDFSPPYGATVPGTATPDVYVVTPGSAQDVVSDAVSTWWRDLALPSTAAYDVSTQLAVTVHAENVQGPQTRCSSGSSIPPPRRRSPMVRTPSNSCRCTSQPI